MAKVWFHGIWRRCGNYFEWKKNILELQKPGFAAPLSIIPCLPFCSLPPFPAEQPPGSPRIREEEKTINFPPRDQDFWDITRTDGWAFQNLLVSPTTKRFGRFLDNNHEDLILQDYSDIKGSVQVGCFQSGSQTNPFDQSLMIIPSSKRQFWGIWLYRNLMAGIFSELSTSLNKSSAAKSTNNWPLQNLSALDHHSDLISHHDRQKLPISALIQSKRVKDYTMVHIISM